MKETKKKINVLIVMRWPVGGIRTFCRYVYNNFDRSLFKCTVLAPNVKELETLMDDLKDYDVSLVKTDFKGNMAYLKYSTVAKTIFCGNFDVVHSHGLSAGLYCSLPAKLKRIPHIMTSHDVFMANQMKGISGGLKKIVFSVLLPLIDKIHHVSFDARDNMLEYIPTLKLLKKKNIVALNGINIVQFTGNESRNYHSELGLPSDTIIIGFMGRFMAQKGFRYLVDAVEILVKQRNILNFKVMCFGWGGYIREEQAGIKQKEIQDYFVFLPFTVDVASSLKGLDVIAIPSLWEACPLLPMEAMVAGIPVIGTNCVGLKEVLSNTPAVVIPPCDSKSLADALIHEMEYSLKGKAESFSHLASQRFDVRKQAETLEKLIVNKLNDN